MHLLLDFDGVLFHNKNVHSIVADRSVAFVKQRLNLKTYREARFVNRALYPLKGHTALIFEHDPDAVLEYNKMVFDETLMYMLPGLVNTQDYDHLMKVRRLRNRLSENVRVGLCTNTTFSYCQEILDALGTSVDELFDDVFTSDYGLAKPQIAFWNDVESQIPERSPIVLLDDSPLNIQGVQALKRPHWKSVLVSDPESLYLFLEFLVSNNF